MWGDYCIHDVLFDNTSFDLQTIGILRGASMAFYIIFSTIIQCQGPLWVIWDRSNKRIK